eukprot:3479982-Pyramimonas_sp.AAC.1
MSRCLNGRLTTRLRGFFSVVPPSWYQRYTRAPEIDSITETPPCDDFDATAPTAEGAGTAQSWLTSSSSGLTARAASESSL